MSWRRYVPHPGWSIALAATWLSLVGTLYVGHVLFAIAFGLALPFALRASWPARRSFARPLLACGRAAGLLALVLADVVVANLQVARAVLGPVRRLQPGFVEVPLELDDERAIVLLAHTVTLTPGTLSVDVSPDRRTLLVHALDVPDPAAAAQKIKARYERRIREIYAC